MRTIKLSKEKIDEIFEQAEEQVNYWLALYQIAFKDWDDIKHVEGYPKVSKGTNTYLFDKAIRFDKEKHPSVVNGGLWLDKGFGHNEEVKDWEITLKDCIIEYNE